MSSPKVPRPPSDVDPNETMLADMARCEPSSALSTTQETGKWYLVDYESDEGVTGTMMYADSREEPPTVTLPLSAMGWHKVYVGIKISVIQSTQKV